MSVDNSGIRPKIGSEWQHSKSGQVYKVEDFANVDGDRPKYPEHIIYRNVTNGKLYTRRLDDWHRSMVEWEQ